MNMILRDKLILTDADGVLLDWFYSFTTWMLRHGYERKVSDVYDMSIAYDMPKDEIQRIIKIFNESSAIYNLPPHKDAVKYVKKLHEEHGYVFHCISSLSNEYTAQYLRTKNLKNLFGETVFEKFIYLDTGADKDDVLQDYKDSGCFWVEDKIKNAELGLELGLDSILMDHNFNRGYDVKSKYAMNWKDIYNYITGE